MTVPTIAFVIETTLLTPALVRSYVAAQQVQLDRDLYPIWGLTARCIFIEDGQTPPPGAWVCAFLDNSDQANALGYHDVTEDGLPVMKVFVADTISDRVAWSVTASHEVIETLGDPNIDQVVDVDNTEYARELCDAPEDDRFSYPVDGFHLTAFVTPSWFDPGGVYPFTFPPVSQITTPFGLAEGGYIGQRTLPNGQWVQRLAARHSARQVKRAESRTMRRFAK